VERDRLVTPSGARPGDRLVLTKGLAVEGTAIAAREKADSLRDLGEPFLDRCRTFLTDPGISVLEDARVATEAGRVHAMHDPTEGGLATGLAEMAEASGLDLVVDPDTVPVLPETRRVCDALGLDPWGLIASGSLLIAVEPGDAGAIVEALGGRGIPARVIGRFVEGTGRAYLETGPTRRDVPRFDRDEVARLFD
jgi:hydrogenase maturation factor